MLIRKFLKETPPIPPRTLYSTTVLHPSLYDFNSSSRQLGTGQARLTVTCYDVHVIGTRGDCSWSTTLILRLAPRSGGSGGAK